jgi:hypothetical protein
MTGAVAAIVGSGLALAVALGIRAGLDALAVVILVGMAGLGILAVAAARRMAARRVGPVQCGRCAGLVSLGSPLCTHCGAPAPTGAKPGSKAAPRPRSGRRRPGTR